MSVLYCKYCGNPIKEGFAFCNKCGKLVDSEQANDRSSIGFAVLGFFFPLMGLILYLVYDSKQPKRAKSVGTGALVGFITKIVLVVICAILMFVFTVNGITEIFGLLNSYENTSGYGDITNESAEVTIGEFFVTEKSYSIDTVLPVTIKNITDEQRSYFITIEAVDSNGARLGTDTIYADRLNPDQEIHLSAFEYIQSDELEQYKNATFKVLEINTYKG